MSENMNTRPYNPDPREEATKSLETTDYGEDRSTSYESPQVSEASETEIASVDVVSGEKKITMSAPVKEFEEFKESFKNMMFAFARFIEAAGMEIGKDETKEQVNLLAAELQQLKEDVKADEEVLSQSLVPRDEFEAYKAQTFEKDAEVAENYVRRAEFEKFRQTIRDAI